MCLCYCSTCLFIQSHILRNIALHMQSVYGQFGRIIIQELNSTLGLFKECSLCGQLHYIPRQ